MNGNRMKYSSTPTYGMQKRSPLGKNPLFQQKSVMGPDFARRPSRSHRRPGRQPFYYAGAAAGSGGADGQSRTAGRFLWLRAVSAALRRRLSHGRNGPRRHSGGESVDAGFLRRCRSKPAAFSRWAIRCRLCRIAASALVRRVLYRRRRLPPPMCSPRPRRAQWAMPPKRL